MLKGVSHVMLFASDVNAAVKWYEATLGFTTAANHGGEYAQLRHPELAIGLDLHRTKAGDANIGHGPVVYFTVVDLDGTLAALKAKGVKVTEPRREGASARFAACYDPEGNVLGLQEARR